MKVRYFSLWLVAVSFTAGGTLRAGTNPHADRAPEANRTWTNDDLERLSRIPGLISVVGQLTNKDAQNVDASMPQLPTEDPAWYAAQAASLNGRLEDEQSDLRRFKAGLRDAQDLEPATYGINLNENNSGITPQATLDILQKRISRTQGQLDALQDLARRNSIPPGILRGE